jgi:hypothetical protein
MPAHRNPLQAHQDSEVIVYLQGNNRRPTTNCLADDFSALHTPAEMT